jgi:tetratricopeptide (TPR) repeat protein
LLLGILGLVAAGFAVFAWTEPMRLLARARTQLEHNPQEADRLAEQAVVAAGGDYPAALLLRSRAMAAQQRWDEALGAFSLIAHPERCESADLQALARAAREAHEEFLAKMVFEARSKRPADEPQALRDWIPFEIELARDAPAEVHVRRLQQLAPDDPDGWMLAGELRVAQGRIGPAIADYRAARQRCPATDPRARNLRRELVPLLMQAGLRDEARQELDQLLRSGDPDTATLLQQVYLLRMEGQTDEAEQTLDQLRETSRDEPRVLLLQGLLSLDRSHPQEAIGPLERVVALQPRNKEAHYKLAEAYDQTGNTAAAARHRDESRRLTDLSLRLLQVRKKLEQSPEDARLREELRRLISQLRNPPK